MDPELLRQRAAFQKHAARSRSVHPRALSRYVPSPSASHTTYNAEAAKKKKKPVVQQNSKPGSGFSAPEFDFKTTVSHSNAANFGTMAKIVDYMKKRHLSQQQWPLSLQEILDELQVYDLPKRSEAWLREVAVAKKHHQDVRGGILLSELNDCIPNGEKVLEALSDQIIVVPTQVNKRKDKVFFYNDQELDIFIEDEFKQIYRKVSVDHLDEKKIEEYLQKHGIDAMKDLAPKKLGFGPLKRKTPKRRQNIKVQNQHLEGVLEDYE
ncbi:TFIIE beta subunit core domain protein [Ostertagia ostertagi]